eukprot:3904614-Amphidinium_carterae.1
MISRTPPNFHSTAAKRSVSSMKFACVSTNMSSTEYSQQLVQKSNCFGVKPLNDCSPGILNIQVGIVPISTSEEGIVTTRSAQ